MKGILPYGTDETTLKLSANLGETVMFKAFYSGVAGNTYKYRWEMAYFGSTTYVVLEDYSDDRIVSETNPDIVFSFVPQISKFILRCTVVPLNTGTGVMEDILSKVGIYPVYELGLTDLLDVKQSDNWDLGTAKGMCVHAGMMVLWGVHGVEKTLFISDGGDVTYFPFPNNVFTFPDEILKVVSFSGSLLIFTPRKLYYVEGTDLAEMWGPYVLMDNVDFTVEDMSYILAVNSGLLVRMNGMLYILARSTYTGKIGDAKMINISVPILDILFDFPKFIRMLSDRLYKFDISWGEHTKVEQYDFVNYVDNGKIKNIFRFVIHETLRGVFKRYQLDVIAVYDSFNGLWTMETACFPYTGLIASGAGLYSSYVKIGAAYTDVYLEKLAFSATWCTDVYNSMFYGDAANDHVDSGIEAMYQTFPATPEHMVRLLRVVDGDTIEVEGEPLTNYVKFKVRFNYINTPESTTSIEPYGVEASQFLKAFFDAKGSANMYVYLDFDSNVDLPRSDKYGRCLAWVYEAVTSMVGGYHWERGKLLQTLMAENGFIKSYYDFGQADHVAEVEAAVEVAKVNQVGLYATVPTRGAVLYSYPSK
jgi:endonuclease YncB( thermonuclease family)